MGREGGDAMLMSLSAEASRVDEICMVRLIDDRTRQRRSIYLDRVLADVGASLRRAIDLRSRVE